MTILSRTMHRRLPRTIDRREWVALIGQGGIAFRRYRSPRLTPTVSWEQIWTVAMKLAAEESRRARQERRK